MNSHTVDKSLCAVFGCPCLGTLSAGSKWYCSFHHDREAVHWAKITLELNRLQWLVQIIRTTRVAYSQETKRWPEVARAAKREITMHQRSDLLPLKDEIGGVWIARLDAALNLALAEVKSTSRAQPQLDGVPIASETFKKASFSVPKQEVSGA